jgi:hypothetical protein
MSADNAAPNRFTPKLMLVAGGATLLLVAAAAGVWLWLWPQPPAPVKAGWVRLAAEPIPVAASAPQDTASTPVDAPPVEAAPTTPVAEVSFDRLQRRLGEVLGAKGAVQVGPAGELRVLARSDRMQPVSPTYKPEAAVPAH